MSGTRTRTIVFLTALVFCMASLLVGAFADTRDTAPSENTVINYPAYPLRGAPYIVASTYNPAGGGRIVLVFNENVSAASTGDVEDDFVSTTMSVTELDYSSDDGDNVLYLVPETSWAAANFDAGALETLSMLPGALYDAGGNVNTDISTITIGDGPVVTGVVISNRANDLNNSQTDPTLPPITTGPNNNTVAVTFDAAVQFVSTDDAAFGATIEFNGQPLTSAGSGTPTITLSRDGAATGNFLYMQPGVMNLRVALNTVRWTADAVNNAALSFRASDNDGPLLNAVYFNGDGVGDENDVMAIVFDQPVTGQFPITPVTAVLDPNANWDITGGSVGAWFSTAWTNVLKASGFSTLLGPGKQDLFAVQLTDPSILTDHQGRVSLQASPADIYVHFGLGIVRAAYDNKLTPSFYEDDQLYIYFSEPLSNPQAVTTSHFTLEGFAWGDNPTIDYLPPPSPDQFACIVITDFARAATPNPWEPGDRLIPTDPRITDPDLTMIVGAISDGPLHDTPGNGIPSDVRWIPVLDESRPCQLALTDTHETVTDAWSFTDNGTPADPTDDFFTLFLRFRETVTNGGAAGLEDSDQYFLFPVRVQDEGLWDKTKMATYLGAATPIGNNRPRQIDDVTRLGMPISVSDQINPGTPNPGHPANTLYQTVDGFDITSPGMLSFLLAAADWQGNVARIETINPNEYAWTWLRPQPLNPNLRVYVQPEYCGGSGIETGQVMLYGVHFIHDYEVDRVRFEWLKEEGTADECDDAANETWEPIGTIGGIQQQSLRGDPVIYRDNTDDPSDGVTGGDDINEMFVTGASYAFVYADTTLWYSYFDADQDGIYSARDAVVRDYAKDDEYDEGIDVLVIGSDGYIENIPDGGALRHFTTYDGYDNPANPGYAGNDTALNPAYYWADEHVGSDLSSSDYILRENREGYVDNGDDLPEGSGLRGLDLWRIAWSPCTNPLHGEDDGGSIGYSGAYMVRCIAIDRSGNEDVIDQHCYEAIPPAGDPWNPNEIEPVTIDCSTVTIDLTTVDCYVPEYNTATDTWGWDIQVLDLDTTVPIVDQVPHETRFLKFHAVPTGTDIIDVRFQWTLQGDTYNIGPNPDNDTYADLDGYLGYQYQNGYAPYLDDERIEDVNGNFIYDAGDVVLDMGRNGAIDTPVGQLLVPLVLEDFNPADPPNPIDHDGDGNIADSNLADDEADTVAPYEAYYDLAGFQCILENGTITASVSRERPACPAGLQFNADSEQVEFNNWSKGLVDVIRTENEDDEVIDIWHPIADGDPYGIYGPDPSPGTPRTWLVHVTAEDTDGIEWVRLWYRVNPACGGTPTTWKLVESGSMDLSLPPWDEYPDETYPYEFHWILGALDDIDANYQFYAEAMDTAGNLTGIPVYPYGFGFNKYAGMELAHIVPLANPDRCEDGPTVNVGQEYLLTAELDDPTLEGSVQVRFFYAPRIQGETYATEDIDPVTKRLSLNRYILDPLNGGLVVCVNGTEYSEANYVAASGDDFITFTTLPAAAAEIKVNYNFWYYSEGWVQINEGDDVAPYTVEWQEGTADPSGVPPFPITFSSPDEGKAAYDLCAVALLDVDGDGVYDPGSICDIMEPIRSENGNHIILLYLDRPCARLYGLKYENLLWNYTQQEYWPGNPFGPSIAGNVEGKLSGKEADVFATAIPVAPAVIDNVTLSLYHEFHSDPYETIDMTKILLGDEFTMPVTMYTTDYYEVRPEEIENVQLRVYKWPSDAPDASYPMTLDADGDYSAVATFVAGEDYRYEFFVDKIGDDYGTFSDRRNTGFRSSPPKAGPLPPPISLIVTPKMDFWYAHLTADNFQEDTIYRAKVEATDSNGMVGSNMSDGCKTPQGPIVFVYDTTPPNVSKFWAEPACVPGAAPNPTATCWLEATDLPNNDVNVITTRTVVFQYSATETPDEWITFGIDRDYSDGWKGVMEWGTAPKILLPTVDNYDNDGDGEVDEPGEAVTTYPVRAVVFDDGGFFADPSQSYFPGSGNPTYVSLPSVYFDGIAPYTHITDPHDGTVFAFGATIPITGVANDTPPEALIEPGVKSVRFQYKDGRTWWKDLDADGYYQSGKDAVFADNNGNGIFNSGVDTVLWGVLADLTAGTSNWFDIDPTTVDSSDDPIIWASSSSQTTFTIDFDTRQVWSTEDSYVHIRMLAKDTCDNETAKDPLHAEEIVIILDDATSPVAFLQWIGTSCEPTCRYICGPEIEAFQGDVTLYGTVMDPTHWDLSRVVAVNIEIRPEGGTWETLGRDEAPFASSVPAGCTGGQPSSATLAFFTLPWDTDWPWAEGVYELRAIAVDDDGNSDPDNALVVKIRIDRTPPVVYYEGPGFPGFVQSLANYYDDGLVDHTSLVIVRDPDTGDVEFRCYTADSDVQSMTLQWRYLSDPMGVWRPWSEAFNETNNAGRRIFQDFTYEPAQNFGANFVWVAHAEDFFYETKLGDADFLVKKSFVEGPIEWRVLATDLACNSNALQESLVQATVDLSCPTVCDYSVDKPTAQVVPGETMNFRVCVQDVVTDARHVTIKAYDTIKQKWYVAGDGELLPVVEGTNVFDLDGPNTQWWFTAAWAYPDVVYQDTPLDIYVSRSDPAGNLCETKVDVITVEDLVAPDNTKIVLVAGETTYTDDSGDGWTIDPAHLNRLQDNDNIWVNRDGGGGYNPFTGNPAHNDYLVSEGARHGVEAGTNYKLGDPLATYPRWVDEGYMGNPGANKPKVARTVTLVSRTWVDDQSFGTADDGVAKVTFLIRPVGGTAKVLGKDEYQPFYPLYLWHIVWDTEELMTDGVTQMWPDGDYEIAVYGIDLSGNIEGDVETAGVLNPANFGNLEWTRVTVDNTAPKTRMDADLNAPGFQDRPPTDIERNTFFTLYTVIEPESPLNDDAATFYIKRARDLNMEGSWLAIPAANDPCTLVDENWGLGPEDGNPDDTRPYSFDLNLTKAMDPVDYLHWLNDSTAPIPGPLVVGEEYDFVAAGHDLLNNTYSHIDAFADAVTKRSIRIKIVDTIAPVMTIVQAKRNIGDTQVINNPDKIYAQSFEYLAARNLPGDTDLDDVFYVYRKQGTTSWTLLDGTLSEETIGMCKYWKIGPWDLRALEHNAWYEVAAIGVDNVGNQSDPDAAATPKVLVFVDYTAPDNYVFAHPTPDATHLCDWYPGTYAPNRNYDLTVTDQDAVENVDTWMVEYYYKLHSVVDTAPGAWTKISFYPVVHDDATNSWMQKFIINNLDTELWDMKAIVTDVAGNYTTLRIDRLAWDETPPTPLAITNIAAITPGAPPITFHSDGQTDIAAGIEIRVWASAKDDEIQLPEDRETAVATMQFYATVDNGATWMDLGTIVPAADQGDPTDYAGYVDWNTTGIPVGTLLWVGVVATDECGNETSMVTYRLKITDIEPPTARIIAFDPDLQPHGENPPTCVKIYAVAESDSSIENVFFQYDTVDSATDTDHEWVNIGVGQELPGGEPLTTEVLWWTAVKTNNLPASYQNRYWLRALARDEEGNRYGDNPTDVVPTMLVELETLYDGSITFKPVRTATPEVQDVSIQVESPTKAILTIKMASSADRPRVAVLGEIPYVEEGDICLENDYYWIYSANVLSDPDHDYFFGLTRSLDDPTVWRGQVTLRTDYVTGAEIYDCLKFNIFVTGTDQAMLIDDAIVSINEYPVTSELGTNGTVRTNGYGMVDANKVEILSGAWQGDEACLLVSQTIAPSIDSDQAIYLEPVKKTAYHMEIDKAPWSGNEFTTGYHPIVQIKYLQAEVEAALAQSGPGVTEDMLTVRRWGHEYYQSVQPDEIDWKWLGDGISDIHVDTVNNIISFRVDDLTSARCEYLPKSDGSGDGPYYGCGKGNIFQLFVPKSSAPVFVFSVTPHSEYRSGWWTDPDPVFTAYLNDIGGQGIDPTTVKVRINGNLVATFSGTGAASWFWGIGEAHLWQANSEGTVYELDYEHSTLQRDWLPETPEGQPHIFTIEFRTVRGTHELVSVDTPFWVDSTPPVIAFHGGWVDNPLLHNVRGYITGEGCGPGNYDCMLTVKLTDWGSGIFVRPMRQEYLYDHDCDGEIDPYDLVSDPFYDNDCYYYDGYDEDHDCCWIPIDWGLKYDLWRVDGEDEQADIDEFEERELLHTGTADELLPYIQRLRGEQKIDGLAGYDPSQDELLVRLPVVGGGRIKDKDILEVVLYTERHHTWGDDIAWGCTIDTIMVGGETFYVGGGNCWYDEESQRRFVYTQGWLDQVRNSGSKYVEQRFIVDTACPVATFILPGATLAPAAQMPIEVAIVEDGVGLAPNGVTVKVTNPEGQDVPIGTLHVTSNGVSLVIDPPEGGWPLGEYVITVSAADRLGHVCPITKSVRVENPMLTLTDAYSYPNPFDPASGDVGLHFVLGKTSDVTIKIFDFAGNYVTTLMTNQTMSGMMSVPWGGTAADGTKLANGAYIARVTATDGARTEEANLKVVIWRE